MWTEANNSSNNNNSFFIDNDRNSSEMFVPDLTQHVSPGVRQRDGSTAAVTHPSCTEDSLTRSSGIIPGVIAATVFIAFLLALYAVLWKCMVSPPPPRKYSKVRVRVQQKSSV